jgi:hypothetical protein
MLGTAWRMHAFALIFLALCLLAGCSQAQAQKVSPSTPAPVEKTNSLLHYKNFQGGYEFSVAPETFVRITAGKTLIEYPAAQARLNIVGARSMTSAYQPTEIMAMVLASLFDNNTPLEVSNLQEMTVAGHPAIQQDFNGGSVEAAISGKVVVFKPSPTGFLLVLGSAPLVGEKPTFESNAQGLYEAFLKEVIVLPEAQLKDAEVCPVAPESSYGTNPDTPIMLGGGAILGPARELAYLDNLLDQDGQFSTYRRIGALNISGKALDQVQLYLAGKQLTLYFDLENYELLFAPVGVQCMGKFPLVEP